MFNKLRSKKIKFTNTLNVAEEYAPVPSIQMIPEWYRKMESSFPRSQTPDSQQTIKKCIPVLDAITAGYIIVSPCDVYVSVEDGELVYKSAIPNLIHFHPRKQGYKHPSANEFKFPKWINSWAIETPKGYSTLFVNPMHREQGKFTILEGVVDTDTYRAPVNFPFVIKDIKGDFLIPAGTPIAQVIPFKRDEWQSEFSADLKPSQDSQRYLESHFFNRYKRFFWSKKVYR